MSHKILLPDGWPRPKGYSNGLVAEGRLVFLSGQIGWDVNEVIQSDCIAEQTRQALLNTVAILDEAGAEVSHIVRMTWYITSRYEYMSEIKEIGKVWRDVMGKHYPTMSVVEVSALMESSAKVEIESTAVIPTGK